MAKKKNAKAEETEELESVPTEPEPEAVSEEAETADPLLLGVTLPMGMTRKAVVEVSGAWRDCGMALLEVMKSKIGKPELEEEPPAAEPAPEAAAA